MLNPNWVEWLMNWPIGWTSLDPLPKENFDDWKFRTQASSTEIQSGEMCYLWWNKDPSETPYRPQSDEQRSNEYTDPLPNMPHGNTRNSGRLGKGRNSAGKMRNLRNDISTEKTPKERSLREPNLSESEGQIIGRVAVDIKNRVGRLRAIGNGQVPGVVRTAWELLGRG